MSEAIANPVRRRRAREQHSTDTPPPQSADIILGDSIERPEPVVTAERAVLSKDYLAQLAFSEEPVTIILHSANEQNAPQFQECWVNGRGIEFLNSEGKWRVNWPGVASGYAPIGVEFTTKRKYVEVLARKRLDRVETQHESIGTVERPVNRVVRSTIAMAPLSIVHDANRNSREWFQRVLAS